MSIHRFFIPMLAIFFPLLLTISGCNPSHSDPPPLPDQKEGPPKNVVIHGIVEDQNGNPLSGVLVTPKPKGENVVPIPEIAVYTDEQGKFTWNLPPGEYEFVLTQNEQTTSQHTVSIPDQNEHDLKLTIRSENK